MSQKYTGGFITKSPVAPTSSAASGIWTLDQQQQAQQAGNWPAPPVFMEDLFSTYLYDGTGAAQTITNGINLSTNGGLVWIKARNPAGTHRLFDTARGVGAAIGSNSTGAQFTDTTMLSAFNTTGFSLGVDSSGGVNDSGYTFASWTFRKQPKFFDVVTYTGTGVARTVAHSLGSVPGCMIVKKTSAAADWQVYHQSTAGGMGPSKYMVLNSTAAESSGSDRWNNTAPTSTVFTVGSAPETNDSGATYVAYLFAHNAGGFPVSGGGSTNGISCGSYTGNGSATGPEVTIGYEPQWLLIKQSSSSGNSWSLYDTMRGFSVAGPSGHLRPNDTAAEDTTTVDMRPTATGFQPINSSGRVNGSGSTYIYIAIRRGPMKTPTVGTSVFNPLTRTGTNAAATVTTGNLPDWVWLKKTTGAGSNSNNYSRLTGPNRNLYFDLTLQEIDQGAGYGVTAFLNTAFTLGLSANGENDSGTTIVNYGFSRAPGFFDEVCYTGTGSAQNVAHNLGVIPGFIVCKRRNGTANWCALAGKSNGTYESLYLNGTGATLYTAPSAAVAGLTATTFDPQAVFPSEVNGSGETYVAYLFATAPGVSKVGSYTGTGALLTVDCGFTSGARFVLIKRSDSTGDWWTYDSARGITAGNDPYLFLNTASAEVTGTNYVDTDTTGFKVTAAAPAGLNANGGTYIFLAIA